MGNLDSATYIILFISGFVAGVINVVSGGGSSLTLPALQFSGLNAVTANGTNRIGVLLQTVAALWIFRSKKDFDWKLSLKLSFLTLPGAIVGTFYSMDLGDREFQIILGGIILAIIVMLLTPVSVSDGKSKESGLTPFRIIILLAIGVYGGFIQVGIGFLIMLFLNKSMKMDLVEINIHKVLIVFVYTVPVIGIFAVNGHIDILPGIILSVGTIVGAQLSAKVSLKKGEKFVKAILLISLILISLKLFGIV